MNNKSKFRFAILLFGVLSAFISTSCSGDNNGSLPDDPSQGGGALPGKQHMGTTGFIIHLKKEKK